MKIQNNIFISFIITIVYILLYIWNRFFRNRLPKEVGYHEVITLQDKFAVIICFFYFLLFSYYFLKYFKIIPRPNSKFKKIVKKISLYLESKNFLKNLLEIFDKYIAKGPCNSYDYIYLYVYVKPFIWFCARILHNNFEMRPVIPYILFLTLPRLLIAIILLTEVLFFNYIYFFYKSLMLIIIPLIFKIILYMIEHHSTQCLDVLQEYFIFKLRNNNDELEITFKPFEDPIKLQKQKNLLPQAESDWMAYQNMYSITFSIKLEKEKYDPIANMIIYGVFALAFSIYLIKITGILIGIL